MSAIIEVRNLKKFFPVQKGFFSREKKVLRAVDGVNFDIFKGETLGLVGESGSGKTTIGRLLLRLIEPTEGSIHYLGKDIFELSESEMLKLRCEMQLIFQDAFASLNPRKKVRHILGTPLLLHGLCDKKDVEDEVLKLLETVGVTPPHLYIDRYPHEFSGGQKQRLAFARAISVNPKFIVADEPVSALDMSVRAQILKLMKKLQKDLDISIFFITHDLSVIRSLTTRAAIIYMGEIVELAEINELFTNPLHPYTKALISATPIPNPRKARMRKRIILAGDIPSPIDPPTGCRFHTRCPFVKDNCSKMKPELIDVGNEHMLGCLEFSKT